MSFRRGDIYFVNLDPAVGREQSGIRPALVISADWLNDLPLVITVVIGTSGQRVSRDYPFNVRVAPEESGLPLETVFLCFQLRSLDRKRFRRNLAGRVSDEAMSRVEAALRRSLKLF
jgi:mRNA interferase MazF